MVYTSEKSYCFLLSRDVFFYGKKINGIIDNSLVGSGFVPSGVLNDLVEDNSGQLWFATTNGVIKNWSSILYNKDNAGFSSNNIKTLLLRKDSTLWAGGDNGTIAYFMDSSWISQNLSTKSYVTCLVEDSSHGCPIPLRMTASSQKE
jgi:ligand-binding sensor domain-containing protein